MQGIHGSPVNSPHKGQWRGALMFSLIYAWINGWVNNREASDLRRHRAHYDVTVMSLCDSYSYSNSFEACTCGVSYNMYTRKNIDGSVQLRFSIEYPRLKKFGRKHTVKHDAKDFVKGRQFTSRICQHKAVCEISVCMGFPVPLHIQYGKFIKSYMTQANAQNYRMSQSKHHDNDQREQKTLIT